MEQKKSEQKLNKGAEDLRKIQQRLARNSESLQISRLPKPTKQAFIELANKDFVGDYGMALKWLMDDLISGDIKDLIEQINIINERLSILENSILPSNNENQKEKIRTMLSGKEIKVNQQ